ncbi:uncharacterized protein LOC117316062 [Pecten maximus]|uniref:uncharacterized protein LOC117316062 n=1 Tax=Pecten maximus TaxID=6579 RepID=UPI001458C83B|nr:uncharacterized protein LOC117316062 [Pecten maximus]
MRNAALIVLVLVIICLVQIQGKVLGKRHDDNRLEEVSEDEQFKNEALSEISNLFANINMMDGTLIGTQQGKAMEQQKFRPLRRERSERKELREQENNEKE